MFIEVSQNLRELAKYFPENLYVVGGFVRNQILGVGGGDVDIAGSVDIEEVSRRLAGSKFAVKVKNLRLGSLAIFVGEECFEYTAFRKEVYRAGGQHSPAMVERTDKIEEDVQRRDFTINAIYYCINTDECVDLAHGIVDLQDHILRTVGSADEVLKNDGQRILRMVRIAGELDFKIEKSTFLAAKKYVQNIRALDGARKLSEIEKILCCAHHRGKLSTALKIMQKLGAWQQFGLPRGVQYHSVFKTQDRFLGLLIDIVNTQNPPCLQDFLEHFLQQFAMPQSQINKIFTLLGGYYSALDGMHNKEYFFKYFAHWKEICPLLGATNKRVQSKYNFFYEYIIAHNLAIKISDLKISESDIAENFLCIDKRNYNKILQNLLSKVFDGKLQNEKDALLAEIKKNLLNW